MSSSVFGNASDFTSGELSSRGCSVHAIMGMPPTLEALGEEVDDEKDKAKVKLSPEEKKKDDEQARALAARLQSPQDKATAATARANELAREHGWPEVR